MFFNKINMSDSTRTDLIKEDKSGQLMLKQSEFRHNGQPNI